MSDRADACRRRAEDCERAASRVTDAQVRATYREMARRWREMAKRQQAIERSCQIGSCSSWRGKEWSEEDCRSRPRSSTTPRNVRVYYHYEFPLFFDGDGERVTAALLCYTEAVDDQRPALHHPGSAGGWSQISAAERHSRCTVTMDETRSAKHRANRAGRPLRRVRSPAIAELPYLS